MALLWQQIIIGVLIGGATLFLVRHFWRKHRRKAGGCAACNLNKAVTQQPSTLRDADKEASLRD